MHRGAQQHFVCARPLSLKTAVPSGSEDDGAVDDHLARGSGRGRGASEGERERGRNVLGGEEV